ncbi:MAG TPA: hypothetical protein DCM87_22430, partial [Planctomycetes bacterium]|nr:hypothetical protein [Planctomycetota bacterium]
TGARCVSIRAERGADAAWTATVTVAPHTFYRLSGWIKTEKIRGATGALLNIQNMQAVRTRAVAGTSDWTRVETVFRSGDATELEINCLFGGWGESTGQAWYDDVALERTADPANAEPRAVVTIRAGVPAVPYSRLLFGGFIEHFHDQVYGGIFEPGSPRADARGFRTDVIAALKELKLSIVRWPGGCFASGYHWKDGIGKDRRPVFDVVWGVEDPNTFGTDEFVAWCHLVGCEPYICTNAGNGTPEEMRGWVAYCNRPEGGAPARHNVRFFSIGNENWGGHEIGARTPEAWGPLVRESAEKMRAVDPALALVAAATADRGWTLPLLRAAGSLLDYVAIHEYWLPCWGQNLTPDYLTCIMHSEGPETTIARVVGLLEEAGVRGRVKIAFDEWNLRGWHHPGFPRTRAGPSPDPEAAELIRQREKNAIASQYTMADALFSASFLNACLRHAEDVGMANIAPIVNTRGPLHVHRDGIVRRTTFHVLAMYANELEPRAVACEVESGALAHEGRTIPAVDAAATANEARTAWSIALVNRHPSKAATCTLKLRDAPIEGACEAVVLAGDSPDAYNDRDHPDRVAPRRTRLEIAGGAVTLPPHSLAIVKLRAD